MSTRIANTRGNRWNVWRVWLRFNEIGAWQIADINTDVECNNNMFDMLENCPVHFVLYTVDSPKYL